MESAQQRSRRKMTEQGLMTKQGQLLIDIAKQNGKWESI